MSYVTEPAKACFFDYNTFFPGFSLWIFYDFATYLGTVKKAHALTFINYAVNAKIVLSFYQASNTNLTDQPMGMVTLNVVKLCMIMPNTSGTFPVVNKTKE